MNINKMDSISFNNIPLNNIKKISNNENTTPSFSEFLNDAKKYEEQLTKKLMSGELDNMHDLSIAKGIANVKFNALTEVLSKITEAYKEISRLQI